jgi:bla regulator protein BlaR1
MLLNVINSGLIDQMMTALSTTLVYSLLQGVGLAAFAGLVIVFTKKSSSAMRYNFLIGALVLFGLTAAVTFGVEFNKVHQSAVMAADSSFTGSIDRSTFTVATPPQQVEASYLANVSTYIKAHHNTIVLIWFLIICIKAIQLAVGLQDVYRLKHTDTHAVPNNWNALMSKMAKRLGIKQKIELLESGLAKVPMVIGHLKPVILIPIGLLTALGAAELEAILMHELAHIRRRDYLVNLLQSLVEIIFFFNPAVLWVSQLIKTERENCCDDMALAHNTSKHSYIQALVSCEEYQQGKPAYAVAFSGQKNTLISRVKRMVNNRNHSLNTFEKTLLSICLVMSGLCLSAFVERETIKKTIHQVVKAITHKEEKPAPVAKALQSAVTPVTKPAPVDTVPKVIKKEVFFDEAAWFKRMDSLKKSAVEKIAAKDAYTAVNSEAISGLDTGRRIISETNVVTSSSVTTEKKLNLKELSTQDSLDNLAPPTPPATPNARETARKIMNEMVKDGLMEKNKPVPFSIDDNAFVVNGKKQPVALAQKYRMLSKSGFPHGATAHPTQTQSTMNKMILQMAKDKLINDGEENFSFKLNNDEFVVNDKKQPDEVFQRYLNDFVKKVPGGKMSWIYSNVSSSKTVNNK